MWLTGTYREIGPVERLVRTEGMSDAEGNMADEGQASLVTVTLEEEGENMTLLHAGMPEGDHRTGAGETYRQAFEKLAAVLETAGISG